MSALLLPLHVLIDQFKTIKKGKDRGWLEWQCKGESQVHIPFKPPIIQFVFFALVF